jgi:iron complex outermembrane receptor protein
VQDLISITDKIKVLAGIRWSYLKTLQTDILNRVTGVKSHGAAAAVENKAFSSKVALSYQPVTTTSIYASYANNFTTNSGVDIYGSQLAPSIIDQYEAGVKNELFKGRLTANLSVYRIINHNFAQMAQYKADGTPNSDASVKELSGETTSDGFDIDIIGMLSKNFYFITGYGYNYMRYTKTSGLKGSNIEGEQLINNPSNTANATLFYTFSNTILKGLKLGASAFYTGRRMGGIQNTNGQTPEGEKGYNRLIPLSGFTTIDVSAGYTINKVSLLAKLSNITNTLNYLAHDRYSINPIAPRQASLTVAYKW